MFRRGTAQHSTKARHFCRIPREWHRHRAVSTYHGIAAASYRYASTSDTPQPASDDYSTERSPLRLRKHSAWRPVDRRDVNVESLAATVQAHRKRSSRHGSISIPLDAQGSSVVRKVGKGALEPSPSRGELHWASFEDFQTQYQPGDKEWERRLGAGIGHDGASNGDKSSFSANPTREIYDDNYQKEHQQIAIKRIPHKPRKLTKRARKEPYSVGEVQPVQLLYGYTRLIPQNVIRAQESQAENGNSDEFLSALVSAFERYMTLRPSDIQGIEQAMEPTLAIIRAVLTDEQILQIHGSYATNLASPFSDVDLNIVFQEDAKEWSDRGPSPERDQMRNKRLLLLKATQKAFQEHSSSFRTILTAAQYPILTVEDGDSSLLYQISCGRRVAATTETVRVMLDEYPTLRPLFMMLRHALLIRGLNDASTGGCGSYTLLIMIFSALKHSKSFLMGHSLGQQLLAVLDFWRIADLDGLGYAAIPPWTFPKYGTEPQPTSAHPNADVVISPTRDAPTSNTESTLTEPSPIADAIAHLQARNCEVRRKSSKSSKARGYTHHTSQLCLQDPADPINDLGYPVFRMPDVIKTLTTAAHNLRQTITEWESATPERRIDDASLNLLRELVAFDLKIVERRRARLRRLLR